MRQYELRAQKFERLAEFARQNGHPELAETAESAAKTVRDIGDV